MLQEILLLGRRCVFRFRSTSCAAMCVLALSAISTTAHAYVDLIFVDGTEGCPLSFADADGDGFGIETGVTTRCNPGAHFALVPGDCNDNDAATHPGATDSPDAAFADTNCDGIDGDITHAVFVAKNGSDANLCTRAQPCLTIARALDLIANDSARYQILVQAGIYDEYVQLLAGKSVYGGYNTAWQRGNRNTAAYTVRIANGVHAQSVVGTATGPVVDGLFIDRPSTVLSGASAMAVLLVSSSGVTLRDVTVSAGNGGNEHRNPHKGTMATAVAMAESDRPVLNMLRVFATRTHRRWGD